MSSAGQLEVQYDLFSIGHFVMIGGMVVVLAVCVPLFFGRKNIINWVLGIVAVLMMGLAVTMLIYSCVVGFYDLEWYVPLHTCTSFVVVVPLSAFCRKKVRNFLKDFIVVCGTLGCIINIVFPITSLHFYAPWHFVSICTYVFHLLMGVVVVYYVFSGNYRRIRLWQAMSVFYPLMGLAIAANALTGANFMFINVNYNYLPMLKLVTSLLGDYTIYYLYVAAGFVAGGVQVGIYFFEKYIYKTLLQIFREFDLGPFLQKQKELLGETAAYKYITESAAFKRLMRVDGVVMRLCSAILKSGILTKLIEMTLDDATDPSKLTDMFKHTGVITAMFEAIRFKDVITVKGQLDKTALAAA